MKKRIYTVLEVAGPGDKLSRAFDWLLLALIALNVVAMILESMEAVHSRIPRLLAGFELFSVLIFSAEYILRVWSCTVVPHFSRPLVGRLRYISTPLALIDLVAVLPFYLPFFGIDLRSLRAIRLFRLFRVAKLGRYSESIRTIGRVLTSRKAELLTTLFGLFILMIVASTLMYFAERDAQPEAFSSIPAAMWWAVETLSTVGYGDVCPVTTVGKLLAAAISILGIGMFALPTGILGAAFVSEIQKNAVPEVCPNCKHPIGRRKHSEAAEQE